MASRDWEGSPRGDWNPRGLATWACSDRAFWHSSPLCEFGPNRTVKWRSVQDCRPLRFSLASDVISCRRAAETIHRAGLLLWQIQGIVRRLSLPTFSLPLPLPSFPSPMENLAQAWERQRDPGTLVPTSQLQWASHDHSYFIFIPPSPLPPLDYFTANSIYYNIFPRRFRLHH